MLKTYQVVNDHFSLTAPAERRISVEETGMPGDFIKLDCIADLGKGERFRTANPDEIVRFDHLVALGYLTLAGEDAEFEEPQPKVEAPILADGEFIVIKAESIGLQGIVLDYKSPDMKEFKAVTGSLAVTPGVKLKAQGPSAEAVMARLIREKIIAKE